MNWPPGSHIFSSILGFARSRVPWSLLGFRSPGPGIVSKTPQFAVQSEDDDLRFFTVRGGHLAVTDALSLLLRELPGPMGLVLVEADSGCEWVGPSSLNRGQVLHAVMTLRDVLGQGPLDFAAFSEEAGTEIYLDRWGTLEIRVGAWKESMLCRFLEHRGFRRVSRLSVLPPPPEPRSEPAEEEPSTPVYTARLAGICVGLGLTGGLARPVPKSS